MRHRDSTSWPKRLAIAEPNEPDPRRSEVAGHDFAFERSCPDEAFDLLCEVRRAVGELEAMGYTGAVAVALAAAGRHDGGHQDRRMRNGPAPPRR
jgi:hypothetical protein